MHVRAYDEKDLENLKRIHGAQGFAYSFPDLTNPLFLTKLVLVGAQHPCTPYSQEQSREEAAPEKQNTREQVVGAALLRLTAEAYLLLDPNVGTPRERWQSLLTLHAATEQQAALRGLEDVHAWLPPEIAAKFGKRLTRLGWVRDDAWTPYCRRLK
jgi:hypothetical protein